MTVSLWAQCAAAAAAAGQEMELCAPGSRCEVSTMPEVKSMFREVLPKQGQLCVEDVPTMVLCKPKLLPLKSVTLTKLEKMQRDAQETIRQQEMVQSDPIHPQP
ncbi:BBSome-interacting protein 1 [Pseudophryne corroboree]|uniref:BBSome-interacting protein 1 n=1 Tax=Pseudophryne corroboree TaxID=495146 RepID=UPI0030817CE1